MLKIKGLKASINGKAILKGLNLEVKAGEVHAIMGPNGSGKSTLASVLAGRQDYEVTGGSVTFDGKDLLDLAPEARAGAGLFLAFQYKLTFQLNFQKTKEQKTDLTPLRSKILTFSKNQTLHASDSISHST